MPPDIPVATYRLQLTADFGFDAAAKIVPYLKRLGISHVYASPFLKARPGSTHGYDVVDHGALNPELGGEEGFARLTAALQAADLGLILDFVPNHMAVGQADNAWWLDVLEWGPRSPYAPTFDISWELLPHRRGSGVLLPILGRPYGDALEAGEVALRFDSESGAFSAWYFEHRLPISPQRYSDILRTIVGATGAMAPDDAAALLAIADDYGRPQRPSYEQAATLKQRLAAATHAHRAIAEGLLTYRPEAEGGVNRLHRLLERQHYRLAYWRLAPSTINYRRFFDINELAGIRVEHVDTFWNTHRLVLELIAQGRLHGLRLDHIDGLADPAQYARRLQRAVDRARGRPRRPFYVVMEKILAEDEPPPAFAGIAGTTGYEWLNLITRVLLHEPGRHALDELWREAAPAASSFPAILDAAKLRILDTVMASEFNVAAALLSRIAAGHLSTRDFSPVNLRAALRLFVIEFPIYRTYVTASACAPRDRSVIEGAIARAKRRWQGADIEVFDFLRDAVTLDLLRSERTFSATRLRQFVRKLQQLTGPVMAKSLEDTALYRHHALLALNEVGGHPKAPAATIDQFHAAMQTRMQATPYGLTATATHDTKRGEDARMRILAIAEFAGEWRDAFAHWRQLNSRFTHEAEGERLPSRAHEYMLYQALVGSWPLEGLDDSFAERIAAYAIKAAREGKEQTSWIQPQEAYETALDEFVRSILDADESAEFLASMEAFAQRAAMLGALNSLALVALKTLMPGVPDLYQGAELWDLSLVDPDNRRPVDFRDRSDRLDAPRPWSELAARWQDGEIKLSLTARLLSLRQRHPALFRDGTYLPVKAVDRHGAAAIAFLRAHRRERALIVVGRHFREVTSAGASWPQHPLTVTLELGQHADAEWRDALASCDGTEDARPSRIASCLPVAVLYGRTV